MIVFRHLARCGALDVWFVFVPTAVWVEFPKIEALPFQRPTAVAKKSCARTDRLFDLGHLLKVFREITTDLVPIASAALHATNAVGVLVPEGIHVRHADAVTLNQSQTIGLLQPAVNKWCKELLVGARVDPVVVSVDVCRVCGVPEDNGVVRTPVSVKDLALQLL